jgi:hypothetical protein
VVNVTVGVARQLPDAHGGCCGAALTFEGCSLVSAPHPPRVPLGLSSATMTERANPNMLFANFNQDYT